MILKIILLTTFISFLTAFSAEKNDISVSQDDAIYIVGNSLGKNDFETLFIINTISETDFQEKLVRNLTEALRETPGVLVQKTANGQGSPFLRGFTGYRTLAMIDGIRYNNSVYRDGPNEYFSLIDFQALKNIKLLLGPSSILYGSDAIGGALNLQTKSANFTKQLEGYFFDYGSQSYRFSSAEESHMSRTEYNFGEGNDWGLHIGYSFKHFGEVDAARLGEQPKTGYDEMGWDIRFDKKITHKWTLTLAHQGLTQDDVWRTHSTHHAKSWSGTEVGSDQKRLKDHKRSLNYAKLFGLDLNSLIDRATFSLSFQTWEEQGERIRSSGKRVKDEFDSKMAGIDIKLESDTGFGQFIYGFDYYRDSVDTSRKDYNPDGSIDQARIQGPVGDDSTYDLIGVYLNGEFALTNRLNLLIASRYSYTKVDIGKYEDPVSGNAASYEDSWSTLVNSIRLGYDLDEQKIWKVWTGLSQSFRAPNIADISRYGGSRSSEIEVAATGLDPEEFLTYEIGLKAQLTKLDLSATYYYTWIDDFITSSPTGNIIDGDVEVSKQNSSEGYVQGIELDGRYFLNENWEAFTNFTWLETQLEAYPEVGSTTPVEEPMSRTMPITTNAGIRWTRSDEKLWISLSGTITDDADKLSSGDKNDTQRIPPGGTPGYTVFNLRAGYQCSDSITLNIGLENFTDEDYRSHDSGTNEPGIGLTFGLRATF